MTTVLIYIDLCRMHNNKKERERERIATRERGQPTHDQMKSKNTTTGHMNPL